MGEADICACLGELLGVELIIVECALLWGWDRDLFVSSNSCALQDCLKMVFLLERVSITSVTSKLICVTCIFT
jgi:hypothetical protein